MTTFDPVLSMKRREQNDEKTHREIKSFTFPTQNWVESGQNQAKLKKSENRE